MATRISSKLSFLPTEGIGESVASLTRPDRTDLFERRIILRIGTIVTGMIRTISASPLPVLTTMFLFRKLARNRSDTRSRKLLLLYLGRDNHYSADTPRHETY